MLLSDITRAVARGEDVATDAGACRAAVQRDFSKGDPTRERAIAGAIELIDEAMKPIRSMIGKLIWEPIPEEQDAALRSVSKRLQYERRQLKKMRA